MTTPVVVLMCGIAGSGKTTYALQLERQGYVRLSIDEEIWRRFGRFGVDYSNDQYGRLSDVVEADLRQCLVRLIEQGQSVVVDFSFWQRESRDRYKQLIEQTGATWRLIYMKVDRRELSRRLAERSRRVDANAAFSITAEILDGFIDDFQEPRDEGEETVS